MLFAHGDSITHFYAVLSGTMQLFPVTPDGCQKTIAVADDCATHQAMGKKMSADGAEAGCY